MSDAPDPVMELFDEFATAYAAGGDPDVLTFLDRAGESREVFVRLVDAYLQSAPLRPPDELEAALLEAHVANEPALFVLRRRRRLETREVARRLAGILGLAACAARIERRYQQLELDQLDPARVAGPVWAGLSTLFGGDVRDLVAATQPPPPAAAPTYARLAEKPDWAVALDLDRASAPEDERAADEAEVDRLFGVGP